MDKHSRKTSVFKLLDAIAAKDPISGSTHNFYRYPARFSLLFVREVISQYSSAGDTVLDPFMGGGTSIVEALSLGRKAIGLDVNSLAHFVTTVKTTPLSENDYAVLERWSDQTIHTDRRAKAELVDPVKNFPPELQEFFGTLKVKIDELPLERQRRFARCAVLETAQWAADCKKTIPDRSNLLEQFLINFQEMISGMHEFIAACGANGVKKSHIRRSRNLLCRSAIGLRKMNSPEAQLVLTSPPYPAVHVLYHRWQLFGRKETPAPYWLTNMNDGNTASFYTMGSRSARGLHNYFRNIEESFRSIRGVISPTAMVVQMVAFSEVKSQLPRYLTAMERAGYTEFDAFRKHADDRPWRSVPNRKWYCYNGRKQDSAKEVVLFHRPISGLPR
jgi:DNA modification methylase